MEHKLIRATWKSSKGLIDIISKCEVGGWSVAALGEIFGGNVLVFLKDGNYYTHEVIQIFWKLREKVTEIIQKKEEDGWQVAAIGDCLGSSVVILKKSQE